MSRAWLVWGVGLFAYIVAVLQRTSLGVAGLDATERFSVGPSMLSMFVVLQIVVYAGMQIPSGVLLDRYGSRALLVCGALIMAAGQFTLAFTESLPIAIGARVLVGIGDALTFLSVLRLVPRWFEIRRVPLITQLTGILGQTGQILSTVPLLALISGAGWSVAFGSAASMALLSFFLVALFVKDSPIPLGKVATPLRLAEIGGQLKAVWLRPGTRLGFFAHMGTQFSGMVFALLWGMPYLVTAQGLSAVAASSMLTLFVLATIVIGPLMGEFTARHPLRRSWLVLTVIGANIVVWTVVLALPSTAPLWLLVVLVVVTAAGGPGSVVGFDYARTSNPHANLGLAQGMVNQGGFLASLVVLAAVGGVLGANGGYSFESFRLAWLVQYPIWIFAVVAILITRGKARRYEQVQLRPLREVFSPRGGWRRSS
ncbi:MFS transporter [Tomitella biformata]|uniref:MFS transporter n=1 Tax=Tomitella biformata TaxID=630403 RepID=UPI00046512E2|nr:MFS transporter [Tomitella biformata]